MIPNELNITLEFRGREKRRAEASSCDGAADKTTLWSTRSVLEGLSRNAGVHAAGVVISDRDLSEYIPLCRDTKGNDVDQPIPDGAAERSRAAENGFLGLENADRDRGRGEFDPKT